jgi:hypothetical protein
MTLVQRRGVDLRASFHEALNSPTSDEPRCACNQYPQRLDLSQLRRRFFLGTPTYTMRKRQIMRKRTLMGGGADCGVAVTKPWPPTARAMRGPTR